MVGLLPERQGVPDYEVLWCLLDIAARGHPFIRTHYMRTDKQRNLMATWLLGSDFTHILMLDADHLHPADVVERLTCWVVDDPKLMVVSGMSFRRGPPFDPNAWMQDEAAQKVYPLLKWGQGLIRVDLIGGSCMLINREVFETLARPFFAFTYEGDDKFGGEDIYFSRKCKAAGIPIYCDTTTVSPHLTKHWITEADYRKQIQGRGTEGVQWRDGKS